MQHWLIATIEGVGLGLTLYLCVRLRMFLGPLIREHFGNQARRVYWLFTILVMIVLSNIGLYIFRIYLGSKTKGEEALPLELWFAIIAMAVALGLIYRRLSNKS
jgi:hypothetical protein